MGLIPLPERGSVDLNDSALHQGIGADELIVGCVVNLNWVSVMHAICIILNCMRYQGYLQH